MRYSTYAASAAAGLLGEQLGRSYNSWTKIDIAVVLDHFGITNSLSYPKHYMFRLLNKITEQHKLTAEDRRLIFRAHRHDSQLAPAGSEALEGSNRYKWEQRLRNTIRDHKRREHRAERKRSKDSPNPEVENSPAQDRAFSPDFVFSGRPVPSTVISNTATPSKLASLSKALHKGPKDQECTVCLERLGLESFPRRKITSSCNHAPDVCLSCLSQSIAAQFTSKVWDQIGCPTCGQRLQFADVKRFADSVVFGKYDNLSLEACLEGAHFQRCHVAGCKSGQYCFPDDDSFMICRDCGGRTCITCDTEWHPNVSCAELQARRAEERNSEEAAAEGYLSVNSKLCPNCHVRGQKVNGCDHMTCPQCRHQYCWICLADYGAIRTRGNHQHERSCKHHTDNLPGAPGHEAWVEAQTTARIATAGRRRVNRPNFFADVD